MAPEQHCAPIVYNGLRAERTAGATNLLSPSRHMRQLHLIRSRLNARAATLGGRQLVETAA